MKRMSFSLLVLLLSLINISSVAAQLGVDDYPYTNFGTDPWKFAKRNCTSFIAWRMTNDNGYASFTDNLKGPNGKTELLGDATTWGTVAKDIGYTVNGDPTIGSVAWWKDISSTGHVAYVTSVSGDKVTIEDYNWGWSYAYDSRTINSDSPTGYIHFKDYGAQRLMGDFNGDHRADAALMFRGTGAAKVALSSGSSFGYPGDWSFGHSPNAYSYLSGDVNGDGRDDLVEYYRSDHKWNVSLSSGNGFWPQTEWAYDGDITPTAIFMGDANGDGKTDKVMYKDGKWYVSTSSGSGFWSPQVWINGHGTGSTDQKVGDFNGDGRVDAAAYFASTGKWYVALSTGAYFGYPGEWSSGQGDSSMTRTVGDATGDNKDDVAYYSKNIYKWWTSSSSGGGFWPLAEWSYDGPGYSEISNGFLADVNGDGRDDKVLFFAKEGNWYVGTSASTAFWPLQKWIEGHGAGS